MTVRNVFKVFLGTILFSAGAGCIGSSGGEGAEASWVSTEFSSGLCADECVFTLSRDGVDLELKACTHEGVCRRTNVGTLTEEGLAELEAREAALAEATLEDRYGCPDCADGGATTVTLDRDGEIAPHQYQSGEPPEALSELDGLVHDLYTSLNSCTASPLLELDATCQPQS